MPPWRFTTKHCREAIHILDVVGLSASLFYHPFLAPCFHTPPLVATQLRPHPEEDVVIQVVSLEYNSGCALFFSQPDKKCWHFPSTQECLLLVLVSVVPFLQFAVVQSNFTATGMTRITPNVIGRGRPFLWWVGQPIGLRKTV
jgi:hypothetical protein